MTRYLFGFLCVCALGVLPLVGCSETTGDGGSGGTAGDGGSGGSGGAGGMPACERYHECDDRNQCTEDAWVDDTCQNTAVEDGTACDDGNECTVSACAGGVCDATPTQDGTPCAGGYANSEATCIEGRCTVACDTDEDCIDEDECAVGACLGGVCDSTPVDNGTSCGGGFFPVGNCFEGRCTRPCGTAEDCKDGNDCTEDTCLQVDGGSRCDHTDLTDGAICAGGTCQLGRCQVTTNDMPCTEQAYHNAASAGCGPYTFDCTAPTEVWTSRGFPRDVILDGGGYVHVDGNFVAGGIEMIGFVIVANGVVNGRGDLRLIESTVTNEGGVVGDGEGGMGLFADGSLILRGCTLLGTGEMVLYNDDGDTLIANSTLSFGSEGGGLRSVSADGQLTVTNSTLRSRGVSPVLSVTDDAPAAMVTATIVDGECVGLINSNGYNLESPGNTCSFDQTGDQSGATAEELNLGPLADNDGPTMTHALGVGSVAIDQIPAIDCEVDEDQRGVERPQGNACDVGAVEMEVTP